MKRKDLICAQLGNFSGKNRPQLPRNIWGSALWNSQDIKKPPCITGVCTLTIIVVTPLPLVLFHRTT